MHINTSTSAYPLTDRDIMADFPNVSFASPFVAPEGYAAVEPTPQPPYNANTQTCSEGAPAEVDGVWSQQWEIAALSAEVIAANAEAARIAAIPVSVSPRQIRQALTRAGLRASVEAAVAAGDQDTKDWYEFATEFRRDSLVVAALGSALGVSAQGLDDLWTLAGSL